MREVICGQNVDGWFRREGLMSVVALFVVVWIPVTVAACKWVADA